MPTVHVENPHTNSTNAPHGWRSSVCTALHARLPCVSQAFLCPPNVHTHKVNDPQVIGPFTYRPLILTLVM